MDSLTQITPIIASLEDALGNCISALNGGGDVALVANALTAVQQALSSLRPVIDGLVELEDEESTALANIHSLAVELLVSLDETTTHYSPRPHAENVELIHEIFFCYPDAPPPDNVVNMPKTLPPEFSEAMHRHIALVAQHGEDSPQAKRSLMEAMHLAPDWFKDDIAKMGNEMDLLPQASGYLEDGSPMFSLNDIAAKFGIPIEQAEQSLKEMLSVRQELGLPLDGVMTDPSLIHRKQ
jgi:hypothetical protein